MESPSLRSPLESRAGALNSDLRQSSNNVFNADQLSNSALNIVNGTVLSTSDLPASPEQYPSLNPHSLGRRISDTPGGQGASAFPPSQTMNIMPQNMLGGPPAPGIFPNYYDQFSDSPGSARHDEFTNWLFDDLQNFYSCIGPLGLPTQVGMSDHADQLYTASFPDANESLTMPTLLRQISLSHDQQTTTVGGGILLSEARWRHLLNFLQLFFNESTSSRGHFDRNAIFSGDFETEDHVLSFKLMNAYIASYWRSYHEQMPILHKPTFCADETPELLLLAIIMIGAAHVPTNMGEYIKDNAHHFATFVAWHLRWHIFMHDDFHPPAKLWVFQALILLEVFEKMKATRFLHERANLHNATTINLIRRGTALVDASAVPNMAGEGMTPQEWWDRWVTCEATRRAAFAAFLIDASHGSMFGHSFVMVAHEIQLPLPCDDALWSATSPSEVGRVEASLYTNDVRPLTFLHGLKRVLGGKKVRTNAFGRMVLLAGLQSVSWHMRQREKASNLGRGLGTPEVWRHTLTRAFDFWKEDFDEDFSHRQRAFVAWQNSGAVADSKTIADYASAMHHLSHLAMQLDIIEAQIMAGAVRVVSRTITDADRDRVSRKLSHWTEWPGADLAFAHAVSLLLDYIPEGTQSQGIPEYSIADDCLTIRPWTLYYAALTAWCYIFVKQHPNEQLSDVSSDSSEPSHSRRASPETEIQQTQAAATDTQLPSWWRRDIRFVADKSSAHAGKTTSHSRAHSLAPDKVVQKFGPGQLSRTLRALEHTLRQSRWELLREAAERLRKALEMLAATKAG